MFAPFLISSLLLLSNVLGGFETQIDSVLIDPIGAKKVADFIHIEAKGDDYLIASPALCWLFETRVADFQQAIAAEGHSTEHFPADIPANRFAFDARYSQAKFIVFDKIWHNWAAVAMPEVAEMMREVETWPLVFQEGEFEIYRNPLK